MQLIKQLNSKYSFFLIFISIFSFGILLLPFFGDIQGFKILFNDFEQKSLSMNMFFVWLLRIIFINLIFLQFFTVVIKKLSFSGIVFVITCLSLVALLFVIWSSNSVNARTLIATDSAKPTVFIYLVFGIIVVSIIFQFNIIFSRLGDNKIVY